MSNENRKPAAKEKPQALQVSEVSAPSTAQRMTTRSGGRTTTKEEENEEKPSFSHQIVFTKPKQNDHPAPALVEYQSL